GLAVTGEVQVANLKRNDTAQAGDLLFLTKPLGTGVLTTAGKRGLLEAQHAHVARDLMLIPNTLGASLGGLEEVHAMTDVTGFGLAGHLLEMAEGSGLQVDLEFRAVPRAEEVEHYLAMGAYPDGAFRNWKSYGDRLEGASDMLRMMVLSDPQTSGGLLVAVDPDAADAIRSLSAVQGPIGRMVMPTERATIVVR
ncbi:MAG: selenide, water dikinase SelD, partial [Flavobacteriales bacterium]|nr:selenide, water dikinase SelD [Flavobacteriales bacterium]